MLLPPVTQRLSPRGLRRRLLLTRQLLLSVELLPVVNPAHPPTGGGTNSWSVVFPITQCNPTVPHPNVPSITSGKMLRNAVFLPLQASPLLLPSPLLHLKAVMESVTSLLVL